ncbi:MAG: hypothetical protein H0V26_08465, partial [Solirubrobacterales bacterium]|nr:hypothetical protein [Solirubrobacterales bacterium]
MPRFANRTPTRRRATVRSRLVRAALLMLVPIFSLEVLGFVQLSQHSERFSA